MLKLTATIMNINDCMLTVQMARCCQWINCFITTLDNFSKHYAIVLHTLIHNALVIAFATSIESVMSNFSHSCNLNCPYMLWKHVIIYNYDLFADETVLQFNPFYSHLCDLNYLHSVNLGHWDAICSWNIVSLTHHHDFFYNFFLC